MMSIKKSYSIFKKQVKDTLKNKTVLIQFVMFPVIAVIMSQAISVEGMPKNYFVYLFATMYIGMAPITSISEIISEEKEKNTLRILMMSNVKPYEYLLGVGAYVFILCMLGSVVFGICGAYKGLEMIEFLSMMAVGILISMGMGAAIGAWSKNQMMATSLTVPVMLVCSFLPMLAMFNETIGKVSRWIYSQQINDLMGKVGQMTISLENTVVILMNLLVVMILFVAAYKKCGLAQ